MIPVKPEIQRLTPSEFEAIRRLSYEKFGLDLRSGKEDLVAARLGGQMRDLGFRSFHEYCHYVITDSTGEALTAMINALTTNHTSFLRELPHFEYLKREIVPTLKDRASIELWSAACSSGEEPYSVACALYEDLGPVVYRRVRILATDISTRVLETAERAVYPADRFQGLSETWMRKFMLRGEGQWEGWYRIKPELRSQVEFSRLNLVERFPPGGSFSVIFCRNVMIYFDRKTQEALVNRLADRLEPGGHLFIGHAESLAGIQHPLQYVRPAIYRKSPVNAYLSKLKI